MEDGLTGVYGHAQSNVEEEFGQGQGHVTIHRHNMVEITAQECLLKTTTAPATHRTVHVCDNNVI